MIKTVEKLNHSLYIYIQKRNAPIFHALDFLKTLISKRQLQSVEDATMAQKFPVSNLGDFFLFARNLETCAG